MRLELQYLSKLKFFPVYKYSTNPFVRFFSTTYSSDLLFAFITERLT